MVDYDLSDIQRARNPTFHQFTLRQTNPVKLTLKGLRQLFVTLRTGGGGGGGGRVMKPKKLEQ